MEHTDQRVNFVSSDLPDTVRQGSAALHHQATDGGTNRLSKLWVAEVVTGPVRKIPPKDGACEQCKVRLVRLRITENVHEIH